MAYHWSAQCLKERVLNGLGLKGNHEFVAFFPPFLIYLLLSYFSRKNGQISNTLKSKVLFYFKWVEVLGLSMCGFLGSRSPFPPSSKGRKLKRPIVSSHHGLIGFIAIVRASLLMYSEPIMDNNKCCRWIMPKLRTKLRVEFKPLS